MTATTEMTTKKAMTEMTTKTTKTTKERITYESLKLFAEKGYKGTSVKNIADAVGIKDSSLYKHFKSKQEILETIMSSIDKQIDNMSISFGLPTGNDYENAGAFYASLDQQGLADFSKKIFLFYLNDDLLSKFWRMGIMEQYQNEQVFSLFRKFFFDDSITYLSNLFEQMSRQKIFIDVDAKVMAISFYTPIYFLLSQYSGHPEKEEEALEILDKQVKEFYRIYRM